MPERNAKIWYEAGLRFTCTQCGNCCTGAPGYVWVTKREIERIAAFLGRPGRGLTREHLRRVGIRHSLTENARTGDCCFLKTQNNGQRQCSIYPVRPLQCRTWPFWKWNLKSPDDWQEAAATCPGMNHGRHHDYVQIQVRANAKKWEDLPS